VNVADDDRSSRSHQARPRTIVFSRRCPGARAWLAWG
jgi:hypothetical protein